MKTLKFGLLILALPFLAVAKENMGKEKMAKKPAKHQMTEMNPLVGPPPAEFFSPDFLKKGASRKIASAAKNLQPSEAMIVGPYKDLRDMLITLDDPQKLITELNKYHSMKDEDFEKLPMDFRFAVAQLVPLRAYAGIIHRMRPILELQNVRIVQDFVIDQIRGINEKLFVYYPSDRWKPALRLVEEPWANEADIGTGSFANEGELQKYFTDVIYPHMVQAVERLKKISLENPIVWDNQVRYGIVTFSDGVNRYRLLGEPERKIALARFYKRMHWMCINSAYSIKGIVQLKKSVGMLYGLDIIPFGNVNGIPRQKVVNTLRTSGKPVFTLTPVGRTKMVEAYHNLQWSLYWTKEAWNTISHKEDFDFSLVESPGLRAREAYVGDAIAAAHGLVRASDEQDGKAALTGVLTRTVVQVNLKNFYFDPPNDLKDLLPMSNGFVTGPPTLSKKINKVPVDYRNYELGNARAWNAELYRKYFPDVTSNEDVAHKMAIVSEARGSKLVTEIFSSFVR